MLIVPPAGMLKLIHRLVIEEEGEPGYMSEGMIEGCLERAITYVYDFKPFPTIIMKAAAIMYCIIVFHPFVDGNKRTAVLAVFFFLYYNGYKFTIPDDSVEFTIAIAEFKKSERQIAAWIHKNSRRSVRALMSNLILTVLYYIRLIP